MFDTPDAAFLTAVSAVNAEDWRGAAAACDPVSLAAFKRQRLEQFDRTEPEYVLTFEQFTQYSPGAPPEVSEYEYARYKAESDPLRRFREELPGLGGIEELKRLPPEEVFASWMEPHSHRKQVERLLADGRISPTTASQALEHLPHTLDYKPIGVVHDGERVAHVLFHRGSHDAEEWERHSVAWLARLPAEEQALTRDLANREHPAVATCRRQPDGTWRLIAGHGFLMLGSMTIQPADDPADDQPVEDNS